jgi:hypothetical protein
VPDFLAFNERSLLPGPGRWKREDADAHAEEQYERFATRRREALEAEGEIEALKQLEAAARRLPKRRPKGA